MKTANKQILYIAGYGRSGSTLLERILSSNARIFGLGELARLPVLLKEDSWTCSCGDNLQDCEFWGEVLKNTPEKGDSLRNWQRSQAGNEGLTGFWRRIFKFSPADNENYRESTRQIFERISEFTPETVRYVVDPSKTARKSFFRPLALTRVGLDVKVIHLVRDGRGCMWSNLKGSNRKMERGEDPHLPFAALRTAISWPLANTAPHLFARKEGGENYLRVKYEDFVHEPEETLLKIGDFIEVDLTPQIEMLAGQEPVPKTHQLAGNRMRKEKTIELEEDTEWKDSLKLRHRLLFWLLDWPWAYKYGYGRG